MRLVECFLFSLLAPFVRAKTASNDGSNDFLITKQFEGDAIDQVYIESMDQLYRVIFATKYQPESRECKRDEFNCGTYCIPNKFVCDGIADCITLGTLAPMDPKVAVDEANCSRVTCGNACTNEDVRWKIKRKCIAYREVCDSDPNCHHKKRALQNEDEIGCREEHDEFGPIAQNAFRCRETKFVMSRTKVCDANWMQDVYAHHSAFSIYTKSKQRTCSDVLDFDASRISGRVRGKTGYAQDYYAGCHKSRSKSIRNVTVRFSASEVANWMDFPVECVTLSEGKERQLHQLWLRVKLVYGNEQSMFIRDDHSDEEGCPHARFEGLKLPPAKVTERCYPQVDCGDGSCAGSKGECEDISRWTKCYTGGFRCGNLCVQPCDGLCDCLHCEDESNCTVQSTGCLFNQIKCPVSGLCAPKNMLEDKVCSLMRRNFRPNNGCHSLGATQVLYILNIFVIAWLLQLD